jgi:hypothetical protein
VAAAAAAEAVAAAVVAVGLLLCSWFQWVKNSEMGHLITHMGAVMTMAKGWKLENDNGSKNITASQAGPIPSKSMLPS